MNPPSAINPPNHALISQDRDRVIEMAWQDRVDFEAIRKQYGLTPGAVIKFMRTELKASSFRLWRKRTAGRTTKHQRRFETRQTNKRRDRIDEKV